MYAIFPFLVPMTLFVTIGAVVVLRGPLGKAIADRVAGRSGSDGTSAETEALRVEVDDLRYRLTDLEERLDFTERVLARHKTPGQLPPAE
jgi:hypothetical protein